MCLSPLSCGEKGHTVKRCPQPLKEEPVVENGGHGGFGAAEPSADAGGEWQDNSTATGGNDWEDNTAKIPAFGGGAPIAATGGW